VVAKSLSPANATTSDLENVSATVAYENGSVASLLYLTQGGNRVPKEFFEVFGNGRTAQLDNFRSTTFFAGEGRKKVRTLVVDKGHKSELDAFLSSLKSGGEMPISLDNLFDTALLSLAAAESLTTGETLQLADLWGRVS
jgi:hypothetical protein